MRSIGEPHVMPASGSEVAGASAVRRAHVRIAQAANDNHRTHAPWRRFVAASMAALFAASLVLVGLICIARADERLASFFIAN